MDFAISRIEKYKMSDVSGVFRESSRNLTRYPNSNVDHSLTGNNVVLNADFNTYSPIDKQIRDYKKNHGIKGRLVENGMTKNQTNAMCQAFFKLAPELLKTMSSEQVVQAYKDCLDWLQKRYPTMVVVGAYIHFDEPEAGVHMHVNFLPLAKNDKGDLIFSTSKLFPGKEHFVNYQDEFYKFACEHFEFDFARRKPGNENAKHLDLPEFKRATQELQKIQKTIKQVKPVAVNIKKIDSLGEPAFFGNKIKVDPDDFEELKEAAKNSVIVSYDRYEVECQNAELKRRMLQLNEERMILKVELEKERDQKRHLIRYINEIGHAERFKQWLRSLKNIAKKLVR